MKTTNIFNGVQFYTTFSRSQSLSVSQTCFKMTVELQDVSNHRTFGGFQSCKGQELLSHQLVLGLEQDLPEASWDVRWLLYVLFCFYMFIIIFIHVNCPAFLYTTMNIC